ncbi:MAG: MotA/TolQ/ExbB proton channel family protein [Rhodobacteraceae bacterium]|nr:MotA/TolQ/ExbB proton channel family protein [Paracoccaceae bacterium]MBR9819975.1 MotA/TolQ/ExbB proton channel family protein [Paracoccaceae bacterium]
MMSGAALAQEAAPQPASPEVPAPQMTAPSGEEAGGIALPGTDAAPEIAEGPAPTGGEAAETTGEEATGADTAGGPDAAATSAGPELSEEAVPEQSAPAMAPEAEQVPLAPLPEAAPAPREGLAGAYDRATDFLVNGGPAIWAIAALSVVTVALILWKVWRLVLAGAWSRRMSRRAVGAWESGEAGVALSMIEGRKGLRSRLTRAAMQARLSMSDDVAREETSRVARGLLASQGSALRALELISTIAPLLGLLGTVMGMISAFQALQEAGSNADPSMLAGGIWEALLTTAAGMAVAIPASAALTWFEAVLDNLRTDLEDLSARIFVADLPGDGMGAHVTKLAAQ